MEEIMEEGVLDNLLDVLKPYRDFTDVPSWIRKQFRLIERPDHWLEEKHAFLHDVHRHKLFSFDLETTMNSSNEADMNNRLEYILFGTLEGFVIVFDIKALKLTTEENLIQHLLPPEIISILGNESLMMTGSKIKGDMDDIRMCGGITVNTEYLDVGDLFRQVHILFEDDDPEDGRRYGLGHLAFLTWGIDYKLYSRKDWGKRYPFTTDRWEWYRTHQLYHWPRPPTKWHLGYLRNDALAPLGFILEVLRRYVVSSPVRRNTIKYLTIRNSISSINRDFTGQYSPPPYSRPSTYDSTTRLRIPFSLRHLQPKIIEGMIIYSEVLEVDDTSDLEHVPITPKNQEEQTKPQGKKRKPARHSLTTAKRLRIHVRDPSHGHRVAMLNHCFKCGGTHLQEDCSISPDELLCTYPLCADNRGHIIKACTTLQARCYECHCRGHRKDQCSMGPKKLKRLYERFASAGRYSRDYTTNPRWAFRLPPHLSV
jgi:hypothetical protein